ncbi:hypothetical protein D3C72_2167490 [compost metagenome]
MLEYGVPQPGPEALRRPGGRVLADHRACEAEYGHQQHEAAHPVHIGRIMAPDSLVDDQRDDCRQQKLQNRFEQLEDRPDNQLLAIRFKKDRYFIHCLHSTHWILTSTPL